jgi:hypothetical protein
MSTVPSSNVVQKKAEEKSSKVIEGESTSGSNDGLDCGKTPEPRAAAEGVWAAATSAAGWAATCGAGVWAATSRCGRLLRARVWSATSAAAAVTCAVGFAVASSWVRPEGGVSCWFIHQSIRLQA